MHPCCTVLALQNATHLMLQQGLALMIARRRETYVRFRELWVLAATAHLVWICLNSGELLRCIFAPLLPCAVPALHAASGW